MRSFSPDHDLPDGVVDMPTMAAFLAAEFRRAQRLRHWSVQLGSRPRWQGAPGEKNFKQRAELLAKARAHDPTAIRELWKRFRLRVVPAPDRDE